MHQRSHNIRHNLHQPPMMRPPHIPSQINMNMHPQQVNMQQPPPPAPQQQPTPQQHPNIPMGTGQIMSQYIPTAHQRDPNRLGHHLPPASQQQQRQTQQPQQTHQPQQPHQQQSLPPQQQSLQQTQAPQSQRISPQMHQPHYTQNRPPNINNNNHGGVNVTTLSQPNPQIQQPQLHHKISPHQQQPQPPPPLQQNYNQKPHHANKLATHQNHKYNSNNLVGPHQHQKNQSKHSLQTQQIQSNSNLQSQPVVMTHQQQPPPPPQPPLQQQQPYQQNPQPQITILQNHHPKILQNPNKIINTSSSSSVPSPVTVPVGTIPNTLIPASSVQTISVNLTQSSNTQIHQIPVVTSSTNQKIIKTSTEITSETSQPLQSQKLVQTSIAPTIVTTSAVSAVLPPTIITTEKVSSENSIQNLQPTIAALATAENISSGKEKTPMCLVNELARYNKIQHQYRLTGEQGPAHSKRFTVTLKLGDEEYTAEGPSIKKAQHTAAAEAITKTKYEHPPPKTIRHKNGSSRTGIGNITPTVELNALAMKLGAPTVYVFDSPSTSTTASQPGGGIVNNTCQISLQSTGQSTTSMPVNQNQQIPGSNGSVQLPSNSQPMPNYYCESNNQYGHFNPRNNLNNIYINGNAMRFPMHRGRSFPRGGFMKFSNRMMTPFNNMPPNFQRDACKITLLVGEQKFVGVGPTVQAAKHDAASRALEILKPISEVTENTEALNTSIEDPESDIKSPISLVHETALKRNLHVTFEVKSELGPPHMKIFITICKVGDTITEGEGNGKKISKKRAAEKMIEELKKLPPLSPEKTSQTNAYQNSNNKLGRGGRNLKRGNGNTTISHSQGPAPNISAKKRTKNLIKENPEPESSEEINPISRLIQIQQASKKSEPVYTVIEEKGAPRRREFTIEVSVGGQTARGCGPNKKIAKKNAARSLLSLLGIDLQNKENSSNMVNNADTDSNSGKSTRKDFTNCNNSNSSKQNQIQSGSSSRQIVPGIIHLPQTNNNSNSGSNVASVINNNTVNKNLQSLSQKSSDDDEEDDGENENFAKDDTPVELSSGSSTSVEETPAPDFGIRPKDELLYLAQLLGFQAVFSDYPKGNHGEYLTIVTLSTDPPQICHGGGANTEASQDKAASEALYMLSKLGLHNVKPKKSNQATLDDKKSKSVTVSKE